MPYDVSTYLLSLNISLNILFHIIHFFLFVHTKIKHVIDSLFRNELLHYPPFGIFISSWENVFEVLKFLLLNFFVNAYN